MKTVEMSRDYSYCATRHIVIQYIGGKIYRRVPEAAVRAIVAAGAGKIVEP